MKVATRALRVPRPNSPCTLCLMAWNGYGIRYRFIRLPNVDQECVCEREIYCKVVICKLTIKQIDKL